MHCPNCNHLIYRPRTQSWDKDSPVREYQCPHCNLVFETVEVLREAAQRQAFQASMWKITNGKEENANDSRAGS